jgi:cobalamin-dependent methionine synthase I
MSVETRLIQIAEMLHASIPRPAEAMKILYERGAEAFEQPGDELDYLVKLIEEQAEQGADFLDVNVDALEGDKADFMRKLIRLVRKHGRGVAPSVDSSETAVLQAGLDEWFSEPGPAPMLNSIPLCDMASREPVIALRSQYPMSAVCLLIGDTGPLGSTEAMVEGARTMFHELTTRGFQPEELYFDTVTLGIASDGCVDSMGMPKPSHTRMSFQAIQAIRNDPEMQGVHAVLGVSNWTYGAKKRRIGHLRAFIEIAMQYGLDAAICDVSKDFGQKPASPELVEFVETFVALDGADDSMMTYAAAMQKAREQEWL